MPEAQSKSQLKRLGIQNEKYFRTIVEPTRRLVTELLKCNKHKRYQAIQKPRIPCSDCWRLWNFKHGGPLPS